MIYKILIQSLFDSLAIEPVLVLIKAEQRSIYHQESRLDKDVILIKVFIQHLCDNLVQEGTISLSLIFGLRHSVHQNIKCGKIPAGITSRTIIALLENLIQQFTKSGSYHVFEFLLCMVQRCLILFPLLCFFLFSESAELIVYHIDAGLNRSVIPILFQTGIIILYDPVLLIECSINLRLSDLKFLYALSDCLLIVSNAFFRGSYHCKLRGNPPDLGINSSHIAFIITIISVKLSSAKRAYSIWRKLFHCLFSLGDEIKSL
nr:MAG TPA: hypothetical protein [Caudoviricetes sp.]